jgi:predicted ATPase/DNA-binding CsgD family transcriptional regulator
MSAHDSVGAGALPLEYSSFVDRRSELAAARAALGGTRLLTILGPGGVGKTRFALRLARSARRLYADGVWFIDLSGVSAAGSVADEVDRILELESASGDRFAPVAQCFASKRGLLVLDNCEQVVEECSLLIRRLLDASPGMSVVATSRAALRISPETVFILEPLQSSDADRTGLSPAVTLFLERCEMFLPDPTPADLTAIAEICERLDGLPLAIELAATRVRALTPAQILDRLAEPLALLTGGGRDVPDRQRTVRATIAWSYSLCTESERALWRRMSVFAGGWDLEAAEWMSAGTPGDASAIDVVQSLVEKSITKRRQTADGASFAMLDTVRMFGLEMTPADELDATRKLHRDWYLRRVAELEADWYGPHQTGWLSYSLRELPNIRAALEFCITGRDGQRAASLLITAWRVVWQAHGRMDEMRRWCIPVVDLESTPSPEICQVMTILGGMEIAQGDTDTGQRRLAQAAELAEQLGDAYSRAFERAMQANVGRDPEQALALYTEALALLGDTILIPARANLEERLVGIHDLSGHAEIAGRLREALIARAIRAGESFETAQLLQNAGRIAAQRGELENATSLLRQALSLAQNLDDAVLVALIEEVLARVAVDGQDYDRAATLLGMSHAIGGEAGAMTAAFPLDASLRPGIEDHARRVLGFRAYDSAFTKGKSLTMAEGIAYALGAQLSARSGGRTRTKNQNVLTARESQVVALVGQGLSDREIADRLVISNRTAEGHVANSLIKLGFTSRTQIAAWTARNEANPES